MQTNHIYKGCSYSVLRTFPDKSVHCIVTSPPYWGLRDYKVEKTLWPSFTYTLFGFEINVPEQECCLGLEKDLFAFIGHLVLIFRECNRVLRDDGTMWVNMGDSYCAAPKKRTTEQACRKTKLKGGKSTQIACKDQIKKSAPFMKPKDMVGVPWMLAFALREDGWNLRQDIIWSKPNPMPESVKDRCTKSHEYIFLLTKPGKPRIWRYIITGEWNYNPDLSETIIDQDGDELPVWEGYSYFFDAAAIATPYKDKTLTTFGCEVKGNGDGSGLIQSENWANSIKVRKPKQWKMPDGWDTGAGGHGSFHRNGRERGKTHKNLQDKGQQPHSMHVARVTPKTAAQVEAANYGINGKGFIGHSGNYDANGNIIGNGKANKRSVWEIPTAPFKEAHFATFPPDLIVDCIKAGCPEGGVVLDPFGGSGTTGEVAGKLNRKWVLIEIGQHNIEIAERRLHKSLGLFKQQSA